MDSKIFEEIYESYKVRFEDNKDYKFFAEKFGFPTGEACRSSFRRERRRRGLSRKNIDTPVLAPNSPKITVFDIECSYMEVAVFELYDQNIGVDQILSHSIIICWSAKILNENKIINDCLTPEEALLKDDKRIVTEIWDLLNSSNILIGHNINNFDLKKLNTRFLVHGLNPIRKQTIDTYLVSRNVFDFPSNSLKGINQYLEIHQKKENDGMKLWISCMGGDPKSLGIMQDYCKHDVLATTELYYKVRPFIKNPPNMALYYEGNEKRCSNCGSTNLVKEETFGYTNTGKFQNLRCTDCGAILRTKDNELDKNKRKSLLVS